MKSPPELWAELSELESLARHLGEFGEIRITKVDPESRVEWEADRASGTVRLEPSGWGTRVVLTVDTPTPEPGPVVPEPAAVEPPAPEPEPEPEPAPVAVAPEPEPEPEREPVKRTWFTRLFRRTPPSSQPRRRAGERREEAPPADEPRAAAPHAERPRAEEPRHEAPDPVEPRVDGSEPFTAAPADAVEAVPPERAFGTIEWETPPEPVEEEPEPEPLAPDDAHAVLTGVLDTLGAAHHRPFSRP